ncbi:hypothetical protein JCGZ_10228 [Jatropha curcas]|uniref:RRM domain-containing protein n=1 Tax=Jatropha curcas TaxID=180498 RepID=A0A067LGC0_JATCU|nr:pre-rRNA-processing protein ESF2 [Jatropha curcas]KDP46388.1 hypothetical protein JCGZ_10228 [Jatropha curcas]
MAKEENEINGLSSQNEGYPNSTEERVRSRKNKKKRQLQDSVKTEDEQEVNGDSDSTEENSQSGDIRVESRKKKTKNKFLEKTGTSEESCKKSGGGRKKKGKKNREKQLLQEIAEDEELQDANTEGFQEDVYPAAEGGKIDEENLLSNEITEGEDEQEDNGIKPVKENHRLKKKKKHLLKEAAKAENRGVCYLSRIPPGMNDVILRQMLSQYGEIQRIYLVPKAKGPAAQVRRKKVDGFRDQEFSEGWVEFANKIVAKRVASMLNGEQIGGRKRSKFYYDLWNIKYLTKFKWDDLTEEIAYKSAVREQKLALELSAAKRERDFYLNKVDQSHALSSIEERLKKKQKIQQDAGGQVTVIERVPKVIRQFPQIKPVANKAEERKSHLSKDILAGVFGA